MNGLKLIETFLEEASAKGTRATILKPLGWMMGIVISATLIACYLNAPKWLIVMFSIFSCITMVLYLIAYLYCLFTDKDALRSESFTIQKLAIEKGFVGDNISGILQPEPNDRKALTDASAPREEEE